MLGAVAAEAFTDLGAAMAAMARDGAALSPAEGPIAAFHAAKREVFEDLQRVERRARQIMAMQAYGGTA
jgi:D-ribulokinase